MTGLGIDPAAFTATARDPGAAVLIADGRVVAWVRWHRATPSGVRPLLDMARGLGARVAVEDIHFGRARGKGLASLRHAASWWVGACEAAGLEVARPRAQAWRRDVLALGPRTGGAASAQAARYAVRGEPVVTRRIETRLDLDVGDLPDCEHCHEAACMAAWAAGVRAQRG